MAIWSQEALSGTLSPEIGNMSCLTYLSLAINQIRGCIPKEIG